MISFFLLGYLLPELIMWFQTIVNSDESVVEEGLVHVSNAWVI